MQQNQLIAAGGGALTGALAAFARWSGRADDRSRFAREEAEEANDVAQNAQRAISRLMQSGYLRRVSVPQTSDFLVGLAFPGQQPPVVPSAFGAVPQCLPRPVITEDMAVCVKGWPGKTNVYDGDGDLTDPYCVFDGQNVLTAMSLGYAENRALLLGLTGLTEPSRDLLTQYFRLTRGLTDVLPELLNSPGYTLKQMEDCWRRFFGSPQGPGGFIRIIDELLVDGPTLTNSAAETVLASLKIPANTINKKGQFLDVKFHALVTGQNGDDTNYFRVRLDNPTTGIIIFDVGGVDIVAGTNIVLLMSALIREIGTTGILSTWTIGFGTDSAICAFDTTIDHTIYLTDVQQTADPDNLTLAKNAIAMLIG